MRKNKLDNIRPFNDFLYRNCYYHQLVSALSCLGIEKDHVFLNSFAIISENFSAEWTQVVPEKDLLYQIGCDVEYAPFTVKTLTRSIDAGFPLIVGFDCYYFSEREDLFMKKHAPHYVSVYGYDLDKDAVTIVETKYINSWIYKETEASLSGLLLAAKRYGQAPLRKKDVCRIFKRNDNFAKRHASFAERYSKESLRNNLEKSSENLTKLKRLFTSDPNGLRKAALSAAEYLQKLKTFYYAISASHLIVTMEQRENIIALIGAYTCVCGFLCKIQVKNDCAVTPEQAERIGKKIDEICALEKWFYGNISEVKNADVL